MLLVKCICFTMIVGLSTASFADDIKKYFKGTNNEIPCLVYGGQCLEDCPSGSREVSGRCPMQEDLGIKCCIGGESKCCAAGTDS